VCSPDGNKASLLVSEPSDSYRVKDVHEKDVFCIRSAWGSDECFPSVGGYPEFGMRDHGWIWGASSGLQASQNEVVNEWSLPRGDSFRRSILAKNPSDGVIGRFDFSVTHPRFVATSQGEFGCFGVYASHALFAAEAGDVLEVWDREEGEQGEQERTLCWRGVFPNPADRVAQKFFVTGKNRLEAILIRKQLRIQIRVICGKELPHLGIWWCNNGWGDGRAHQTIGIEPTNALSDGPVFQEDESNKFSNSCVTERFSYEFKWTRD
jgi:hypothetical protein